MGALCAETGIGLCLHAPPTTSIATAAGMHALATVPNFLLEGNQTYLYHLREDVCESLGDRNAARLDVPLGGGLGIKIDETLHRGDGAALRAERKFLAEDGGRWLEALVLV